MLRIPLIHSFILLSVVSCNKSSDHWSYDRIDSGLKEHNSSRLCCYAQDRTNGVDLEFLSTSQSIHAYLNVHSVPIPVLKQDPKKVRVDLRINNRNYSYEADCHQGRQRVLLPPEAFQLIIETLANEQEIEISVPGYSSFISPEGFSPKFQKLEKNSAYTIPFHLPF